MCQILSTAAFTRIHAGHNLHHRLFLVAIIVLISMSAALEVATAQYVCNGLTVAIDVTMTAGATPNTITNCVMQGRVIVPTGAVLSVIGGSFERSTGNQLELRDGSSTYIDSTTFADTTSSAYDGITLYGKIDLLVNNSKFVGFGRIKSGLPALDITPASNIIVVNNDLRLMDRTATEFVLLLSILSSGGKVIISNNDATQTPLLVASNVFRVIQISTVTAALSSSGPNDAGCYITINDNTGTTDIIQLNKLEIDASVPGYLAYLHIFNNSVASKDSASTQVIRLFGGTGSVLNSTDFIINITQNTMYQEHAGALTLQPFVSLSNNPTNTFNSPIYIINNTITHGGTYCLYYIVSVRRVNCDGACRMKVEGNTITSLGGNTRQSSLAKFDNVEGPWVIRMYNNIISVTITTGVDNPIIELSNSFALTNGLLDISGNRITVTSSTTKVPLIKAVSMPFDRSVLSITNNYLSLTGSTTTPMVQLSGSATVFGVGSRLIFEHNQFGPTTSVFPSTTFSSHGELRPKGCGNTQLDGTAFDVASTEPTFYWETCTRTNTYTRPTDSIGNTHTSTPSLQHTLSHTPTITHYNTITHETEAVNAPYPIEPNYEPPFNDPPVATTGGVAIGVGTIGVTESPSSLQLLIILTTMACRTKDTVGGAEEGQSLLAPLFIPGLGGSKYVVGSFILLASITAVYVLIVRLIFAVIRWRTEDEIFAAERVWKARLFTFYPRLPVVGAVLLMPGVTFDSASLLYGDESRSVWWERLIGAVGVVLCLVLTAYHVVVGFIAAPHIRKSNGSYPPAGDEFEKVNVTAPMQAGIECLETTPNHRDGVDTTRATHPEPSEGGFSDLSDFSPQIAELELLSPKGGSFSHPHDDSHSCSSARSPRAAVDGHNNDDVVDGFTTPNNNNDDTADDTTPHSAQVDKGCPAYVGHDTAENTGTQPHQQQHQSIATLERWFVEYPPAMRDAVPQPLRVALIPLTKWDPVVGRTMYCILTTYRPDVAARVLSHNVVRIFLIGMLAAINPGTEEGCQIVQGFLAAICFVHGLFVFITRAYRVPALTALQGLQSLLLGLVSCVPFMGGDNTRITAGMAYSMIAVVLLEGVVSVLVGLVEFILQRKFRTGQQVEFSYPMG